MLDTPPHRATRPSTCEPARPYTHPSPATLPPVAKCGTPPPLSKAGPAHLSPQVRSTWCLFLWEINGNTATHGVCVCGGCFCDVEGRARQRVGAVKLPFREEIARQPPPPPPMSSAVPPQPPALAGESLHVTASRRPSLWPLSLKPTWLIKVFCLKADCSEEGPRYSLRRRRKAVTLVFNCLYFLSVTLAVKASSWQDWAASAESDEAGGSPRVGFSGDTGTPGDLPSSP